MNTRQTLRQIIESWWSNPLPSILPRETDLSRYFDPKIKKILTIIGFRRTGKTFTMLDFAKKYGRENCVYINLEDERLPKTTNTLTMLSDTLTEVRGKKPFLLLVDEIQEIPKWSLWARRINETTPHRLILSGSSSALSSSEIPTELRGHTLTIEIFPLSFKEFLTFKNIGEFDLLPSPLRLNLAEEYLKFGGLPEIVISEEGAKPLIIIDYLSTFIQRDLIDRYKIRKKEVLRALIKLMPNTRLFTYSKLANTLNSLGFKIGKEATIRFLDEIESSFFLQSVKIFSKNEKTKLKSPQKAYLVDTFFSHFFSSNFSQNIGHLMEQSVYLHLNRIRSKNPLMEIYYWKDYRQNEVDFVVSQNKSVQELIQVSFTDTSTTPKDRELKSLLKASYDLNCQKLTLLTWDFEKDLKIKNINISCIPLYQWLIKN